ncbi:Uma2 family endonuclease [Phormidesmis sp. 146-35]
MVSTRDVTTSQAAESERRIVLHNVSWQAYEKFLDAMEESHSTRLTYYKGILEIVAPLESHENAGSLVGQFIEILTEELGLTLKSMGSTTLKRPEIKIGGEPDKCYYIANEPLVRGRTVNLAIDPPPDLIIEVDITHTDINKNALYAEMGVGEFWRYNGKTLTIYQLQNGTYQEVSTSPTFAWVEKERLYQFLKDCTQVGETQAKRMFRAWIREWLSK